MLIRRTRRKERWTSLPNSAFEDKRLSWKARGILVFILSKPDDWQIRRDHLIASSDKDGRDSVRSAMKELERIGYACLVSERDPDTGKMIGCGWDVADTDVYRRTENPSPGGRPPMDGKSNRRKTRPLSKSTEKAVKDKKKRRGRAGSSQPPAETCPARPDPADHRPLNESSLDIARKDTEWTPSPPKPYPLPKDFCQALHPSSGLQCRYDAECTGPHCNPADGEWGREEPPEPQPSVEAIATTGSSLVTADAEEIVPAKSEEHVCPQCGIRPGIDGLGWCIKCCEERGRVENAVSPLRVNQAQLCPCGVSTHIIHFCPYTPIGSGEEVSYKVTNVTGELPQEHASTPVTPSPSDSAASDENWCGICGTTIPHGQQSICQTCDIATTQRPAKPCNGSPDHGGTHWNADGEWSAIDRIGFAPPTHASVTNHPEGEFPIPPAPLAPASPSPKLPSEIREYAMALANTRPWLNILESAIAQWEHLPAWLIMEEVLEVALSRPGWPEEVDFLRHCWARERCREMILAAIGETVMTDGPGVGIELLAEIQGGTP